MGYRGAMPRWGYRCCVPRWYTAVVYRAGGGYRGGVPRSDIAVVYRAGGYSGGVPRCDIAVVYRGGVPRTQIKDLCAEKPALSNSLSGKPGTGQNEALHASSIARSTTVFISHILVHSTSYFLIFL